MDTLKIVIGTKNKKKKEEIEEILDDLPVKLLTLDDLRLSSGRSLPDAPDVVEDGRTFSENAVKKALTLANFFKMWVMADDSGLEVEALGNRPGVLSNRYAGEGVLSQRRRNTEGTTDEKNIKKLLEELKDVPDNKRAARFRCAIALAKPGKVLFVVEGQYEGVITHKPMGIHGFGYDPVFLVPEYGRTFAELGPLVKNQISHRAQALRLFRDKLIETIDIGVRLSC
ncbi:MAG TPA: RdgB/HAM1 family non-canonical purine NTP pyrophosphatase [Candidatus Brocadiia bacterium]|nr:RdgB/HAM1 family non-canonical purine NTP pyrophosphatase [Planctomycetota bacterium]MDO8094612.1 RdgB/HAM1 family non-canonical purine NTP pyrophosphatase [Candidatus Brocadiales bacterium]